MRSKDLFFANKSFCEQIPLSTNAFIIFPTSFFMKWKSFPVPDGDSRAKAQVIENLTMGAYEHSLSRKLVECFSERGGSAVLIAWESIDLDGQDLYKYATYGGGKADLSPKPASWMDSPRWGLVAFADTWLRDQSNAVVLCENWAATRQALLRAPRESRTTCFGDEVYHLLTSQDAGAQDAIECALRESEHHWATSVCSWCDEVPRGDIPSMDFIDAIVAMHPHFYTRARRGGVSCVDTAGDLNGAENGRKTGQNDLSLTGNRSGPKSHDDRPAPLARGR